MNSTIAARRAFLRFLATSPLMARAWAQERAAVGSITLKDVLNVMDLEPLAHKAVPPAHWGFFSGGVDDDLTLRMNREAFQHYQLRARRLVDVSKADLRTEVFGAAWEMPIYLSALGGQKSFHPEGELATARAAKAKTGANGYTRLPELSYPFPFGGGLEDVPRKADVSRTVRGDESAPGDLGIS